MNVREALQLRVACTRERNCATSAQSAHHHTQQERNTTTSAIEQTAKNGAILSATDVQLSSCAPIALEPFVEPPGYEGTGWRLAGAEGLSAETLARFWAASQALNRLH